jgi:AP-3 complex subunit delta-1
MSLLYECISGIIQGGILEAVEGTAEGEEVAKLCVGKLRGMMIIEGDANCKLRYIQIDDSHSHRPCSKICRLTCFRKDR